MCKRRTNSGIVAILALLIVAILTTVAVAFVAMANSNVMQVDNMSAMQTARMSAEGGLAFVGYHLCRVTIPNGTTDVPMMQMLPGALNARINGNLVTIDVNNVVHVPSMASGAGGSFNATVTLVAGQEVTVRVYGYDGTVCRSISMNYMIPAMSSIFNYGIASKSPVNVSGSAEILGANANIFTDATDPTAVTVGGSATVAGDISTVSTTTTVSLAGSASVGGVSVSDPAVDAHVHQGVPDVPFPQPDPSVFYPYATQVVNAATAKGNHNFPTTAGASGIVIPPNANPTFNANTTISGVLYIQRPNQVSFAGNVKITGVIVTDDASSDAPGTDTVTFGGNVDSYPVGNLPNTPQFSAVRTMTGSFILAPGFGLTFNGNSNTTNGCMAANSFSFGGNSGGNITGSMINYSDSQFILFGSSDFTFNKLPTNQNPAGFAAPTNYSPEPATYKEW